MDDYLEEALRLISDHGGWHGTEPWSNEDAIACWRVYTLYKALKRRSLPKNEVISFGDFRGSLAETVHRLSDEGQLPIGELRETLSSVT